MVLLEGKVGLFLTFVSVCVNARSLYSEQLYWLSHLSGPKGSFISLSVNYSYYNQNLFSFSRNI